MPASIILPDGTPATIRDCVWYCDDPEAIPVLNYFSKRTPCDPHLPPDRVIARNIVKLMTGARFVEDGWKMPPLPPGHIS